VLGGATAGKNIRWQRIAIAAVATNTATVVQGPFSERKYLFQAQLEHFEHHAISL